MENQGERLKAALEDEVGEDLRVVARFTDRGYEMVQQRDDVRSEYTEEEIDEIYQEQVFEWLNRSYLEDLFEDVGELRARTQWFDDIVVVVLMPDGHDHGLFVTIDRTGDLDVGNVVTCCTEALQ